MYTLLCYFPQLSYCRPPFRESDKHCIRGVLFVERGSARMSCVCSSFFSLSVPIELKLVIAYRSFRCASGLYTILRHIDFNHFC